MKKSNKFINNLSAASPVIGVMLMVVVTVILAAAVSSYSTGMLKGSEAVPSASFDVEMRVDIPYNNSANMSYIAITEITGDKIPTSDLKIITINPNARGDIKTMEVLPNSNNTFSGAFSGAGTSPFWNLGNFATSGQFFGEFIMEPGMTMVADEYSNYFSDYFWNEDDGIYDCYVGGKYKTGMQAMFADWCDGDGSGSLDISTRTIHAGDVVTIKIVHMPTNKVIFTKDVVVTG
ncbi:type IV pilin N-terminal domain-containing protein [Methanolobus sp. WCC1]|jgi:FlaG/FlaF family flagellin (archaellin)|uniref:type IV pilin N-terminal domain-containing protein n=1 Tax=unclassified Methanolobus TaxID=2629569 RepID=UPI002584D3EA|nr:type IV pilin N-terminal domain-containing protein [Methanolobus sp.]MDK2830428.1 archaeal type pilus assembly protein PilA [Methanolobus sp.]